MCGNTHVCVCASTAPVRHACSSFEEITHLPVTVTLCARAVEDGGLRNPDRIRIPFGFDASVLQASAAANVRWFDLQTVVMHQGASLDGGHYHTYTKLGSQWWHCDDDRITPVTHDAAAAAVCGDGSSVPYVMTYSSCRARPEDLGNTLFL